MEHYRTLSIAGVMLLSFIVSHRLMSPARHPGSDVVLDAQLATPQAPVREQTESAMHVSPAAITSRAPVKSMPAAVDSKPAVHAGRGDPPLTVSLRQWGAGNARKIIVDLRNQSETAIEVTIKCDGAAENDAKISVPAGENRNFVLRASPGAALGDQVTLQSASFADIVEHVH